MAAFGNGSSSVLVTWEEIAEPQCEFIAMGCRGAFTGAYYQLVSTSTTGTAEKVGEPLKVTDTFVAGDMVTMPGSQRICWPYVAMDWDLSEPVPYGGSTATTKAISFACVSLDGSGGNADSSSGSSSTTAAAAASSSAAAAPSSLVASSPTTAASTPAASASTAESTPTARDDTVVSSPVVMSPTVVPTPVTTETAEAVSSPTKSGAISRPTSSQSRPCRARARRARRAHAHE